jgi:hypothetical protein
MNGRRLGCEYGLCHMYACIKIIPYYVLMMNR